MKKLKILLIILLFCGIASGQMNPMLGEQINLAHPLGDFTGFWLFNQGSGGHIFDMSGNGHHGVNTALWTSGKFGSALDFGVETDYAVVITGFTCGSNFTIVMWAKPNVAAVNTFFDSYTGRLILRFNGGVLSWYDDGGNNDSAWTPDGGWHQIALVKKGAVGTIYVDGRAIYSNSSAAVAIGGATCIGNRYDLSSGYNLRGLIDHVMIYERALTASEMAQLYQKPFCMFKKDYMSFWQSILGNGNGSYIPSFMHHIKLHRR